MIAEDFPDVFVGHAFHMPFRGYGSQGTSTEGSLSDSGAGMLQVTPLLNELRQGNLVGNLENLTKSASEAASDIHRLQTEVTTLLHTCGTTVPQLQ